jgi:hypothetical protein
MSVFPTVLEPSDGYEFDALATYNSECARGIVHTPEWVALMESEQRRFEEKRRAERIARGGYPDDPNDPDGMWIVPSSPASAWSRFVWWLQDRGLFR